MEKNNWPRWSVYPFKSRQRNVNAAIFFNGRRNQRTQTVQRTWNSQDVYGPLFMTCRSPTNHPQGMPACLAAHVPLDKALAPCQVLPCQVTSAAACYKSRSGTSRTYAAVQCFCLHCDPALSLHVIQSQNCNSRKLSPVSGARSTRQFLAVDLTIPGAEPAMFRRCSAVQRLGST